MTEVSTDAKPELFQQGPQLNDKAFDCIARIAHREAGLFLPPGKEAMVRTRLVPRLRALDLKDFESYCTLIHSPERHDELNAMISALTTNVSHFFREAHHFDILREKLLPRLRDKAMAGKRIRIWSAGCSKGQEPFSIAMTLREAGFPNGSDIRILGTDIDPQVIAHARAGRFHETMIGGIPEAQRTRFLTPIGTPGEKTWKVSDDIAEMVVFRELNLLRDWPMRGEFDAIFCRNVLIYFDSHTQDELWPRFANALTPGGWLFLGHSERISTVGLSYFESRGLTSYQRGNHAVKTTRPDSPPAPD